MTAGAQRGRVAISVMRVMHRTALAACLSVALFATPLLAEEPYRVLFDKGLADMEAGRYDTGCPALAESYRIDPRPGTLFTLAECEAKRGRIRTAVARYAEYLALHDKLPPHKRAVQLDRAKIAQKQKAGLTPLIPELTLRLSADAPPGVVVERDGETVDPASMGAPIALDPGEHVIVARGPDGAETKVRVTLVPGERRSVSLDVGRAPPPEPAGVPARRWAAYATGGLGVLGVGLGVVTGALMISKKGAIEDGCRDGGPGVKICSAEGAAAGESAKTLGTVSTVGITVGAAAVGIGLVLLLTEPKASTARPSAMARALSPLLIDAGPGGALVGARGAW